MTNKAQELKEKLNKVYVNRDDLNKLCEDRIAYVYDSLCFRYIMAREKAALWDAYQDHLVGKVNHDKEFHLNQAKRDEMRFFDILNDLIGEHK